MLVEYRATAPLLPNDNYCLGKNVANLYFPFVKKLMCPSFCPTLYM